MAVDCVKKLKGVSETLFRSCCVHLGKCKLKSSMVSLAVFPALILRKEISTKKVRRLKHERYLTYSGLHTHQTPLCIQLSNKVGNVFPVLFNQKTLKGQLHAYHANQNISTYYLVTVTLEGENRTQNHEKEGEGY